MGERREEEGERRRYSASRMCEDSNHVSDCCTGHIQIVNINTGASG
jgi:hypothetical protein